MANLTIDEKKVSLVRASDNQLYTAPVGEAGKAGMYYRFNPTTGYLEKGNATSKAELGAIWGVLLNRNAAVKSTGTIALPGAIVDFGSALDSLPFDAKVWVSATDALFADASPATSEVQTVTITGSPTGGTFTLTFDGQTTAAIAYNAAASAVQAALEALSTVRAGNVVVSGSAGGPYTVTFVNDLANANVSALTASGAGLTGGTAPAVAIATTTAGIEERVGGRVIPAFGSVGGDRLFLVGAGA